MVEFAQAITLQQNQTDPWQVLLRAGVSGQQLLLYTYATCTAGIYKHSLLYTWRGNAKGGNSEIAGSGILVISHLSVNKFQSKMLGQSSIGLIFCLYDYI